MKRSYFILFLIVLTQCAGPEPRRPVSVKTGSFIKQSVERNKELLAQEENFIQSIIEADSLHQYMSTDFGAWYYFDNQPETETERAGTDDLLSMNYNLLSLQNDTIYSEDELGTISFRVDKEELFPGLRSAVKLMGEGETATFLFPSHLAYGYHGDNEKIGPNTPLKSTITILKIEKSKDSILN